MTTTQVLLVRHGETTANHEKRWHGALDAPLTARGELQVRATGERFRALRAAAPIDALYTSPLPRARTTAAAIAAAIGLEPVIDEGLREFSIGDWEGRTFRDLHENENLWGRWDNDPTFAPPNGESPVSFRQRAVAAVQRLVARHPGQRIVLVTHGGVISALLDIWFGDNSGDWVRWDPHNCAVSELIWDGAKWRSVYINDIGHLPPEAVAPVSPADSIADEQA